MKNPLTFDSFTTSSRRSYRLTGKRTCIKASPHLPVMPCRELPADILLSIPPQEQYSWTPRANLLSILTHFSPSTSDDSPLVVVSLKLSLQFFKLIFSQGTKSDFPVVSFRKVSVLRLVHR